MKVNPLAKLRIKQLYKKGEYNQKELSEMFHVSQSQISVICKEDKDILKDTEFFEDCYYWEKVLWRLNVLRYYYLESKDYDIFISIREFLPSAYLYRSTITLNYENLRSMYFQRRKHKLPEWHKGFIEWVKTLPYAKELIIFEGE